MFFFVEPAYLGFFLGFNLIFFYIKSKHFSTRFLYLNFVAGLLTLSLTFVLIAIFIFVLYFLKRNRLKPEQKIIIYPTLSIMLYLFLNNLFEYSSLIDRLGLLNQFLEHFLSTTNQSKLFGIGITKNEFNLGLNFSSGMIQDISEFGIIGLLLLILFLCNFVKYNFIVIGIFKMNIFMLDLTTEVCK
jgi:hypothetical protein